MGCVYARLEIDYVCALRNRLLAVLKAMNWVSFNNLMRLTRRSQPVINTGHYQPFKHPHVTRSQPIGVEKLSEVFMNNK